MTVQPSTILAPLPDWRRHAACRFLAPVDGATGPHWWYPGRGPGVDNHGALAKAVCRGCPVREACLTTAILAGEDHGIHGGAGEARRRVLRRAMADGTFDAALAAHWRRLDGEEPRAGDRVLLEGQRSGRHGRASRYAKGCRCGPCSLAVGMREVSTAWHRREPVPLTGRRLDELDELFGAAA